MSRTPRISTSSLMVALLHAARSPASEQWLIALASACATLTAGADPMPISGVWS